MAHGLNSVFKRSLGSVNYRNEGKGVGSRRIFAPHFKLQVLDSYRNDIDCKGNQRATARKYGIHRRQIQKWLQVENTLRNSVSNVNEKKTVSDNSESCANINSYNNNCEMTLNDNRQLDDESASTISGNMIRVPALSQTPPAASSSPPLPIDYTIHSRIYTTSPIVAKDDSRSPQQYTAAPIDLSFKRPYSMITTSAPMCCMTISPQISLPSLKDDPHPDVWDLSIKKFRSSNTIQKPSQNFSVTENYFKPIKLFKPYLDDIHPSGEHSTKQDSCCPLIIPAHESYYNYDDVTLKNRSMYTYTLHELQPKSINNNSYSPYPNYEVGICSYEDISYVPNSTPIKQRQSYSLDFKLSAIDCYYKDSICKGNQRAVATRYNIHRRQIQKWLKQASELKLKNESMKKLNSVR